MSPFGQWLQMLMRRYSVRSVARLAIETGIDSEHLQSIILGDGLPNADDCVKIARKFKIAPEVVIEKAGLQGPGMGAKTA